MNSENIDENKLSDVNVHAGFPNPATDSDRREASLSLDQLLIRRPSSTYMFRLSGHQWAGEGIADGDIAVVDRAYRARPRDLVIAWRGDDFMLTRAHRLPPDTPAWGVVSAIVHRYREEGQ
jgi:DNA polymerase V